MNSHDSWPRVTEILRDAGLVDASHFTDFARERGTAVHLATALDDQDDLDEADLDEAIVPYLAQYRRFKAEMKPKILDIEKAVSHEVYRYRGTLDRIARIAGREGVLDLKCGTAAPWHQIQLALYSNCVGNIHRWNLYLRPDGYTLVERKDRNDRNIALAALTVANWRRANGNHT